MEELRKKLKAKKQVSKQVDVMEVVEQKPPKGKKDKKVKSIKEINKSIQEDKDIRKFFAGITGEDDVEVIKRSFKQFSYGKSSKKVLDNVIDKLPEDLYKDFITEYLDQDSKNIQDFYDIYTNKSSVKAAINKKIEDADKKYDEKKRLQQINLALFGDVSSDEEEISLEYKPKKSTKKIEYLSEIGGSMVGEEEELTFDDDLLSRLSTKDRERRKVKIAEFGEGGEIIEVKSPRKVVTTQDEDKEEYDIKCIVDRRNIPWIKDAVLRTYVAQVDEDYPIDKYVSDYKKSREEQGYTWYPANNAFIKLMCNHNSSARSQKGQIHTAFTNDGKKVNIMVAYETNKGFIVQDESVFNAEKQYERDQTLSIRQKLELLLDEPLNSETQEVGVYILSGLLHSIAPTISDYGIYKQDYVKRDTSYILKAIETISNSTQTNREFLTKLAGVVIYLQPRIDKLGSSVFKKRVQEEYYLPEILVNLSTIEKLPEVFENPRATDKAKEYATRLIKEETDLFVLDSVYTLFSQNNVSMKRQNIVYRPLFDIALPPKIDKWKSACVNKDDVAGIPDEQTVYYTEDDDVYCLVIDDIVKQIIDSKTPVNPVTKQKLDKTFIKRFTDVYNGYIAKYKTNIEQKEEEKTVKSPLKKEKELAPGLLDMIIDNIKTCEDEVYDSENGDDKGLDKDKKCKGLNKSLKKKRQAEEEEVDEVDEIEDEVEDVEGGGFSPLSQYTAVCENCKDNVDGVKCLKTKVKDGDSFKTINFCCFNCFEKYDTWPKMAKKMNGKKGGRKGTKERKSKKSK